MWQFGYNTNALSLRWLPGEVHILHEIDVKVHLILDANEE